MPSERSPRPVCPSCGGRLHRRRRTLWDRLRRVAQGPVRRWSCKADACGWAGTLPRGGAFASPAVPSLRTLRIAAWGVPAVGLITVGAVLVGAGAWGWKRHQAASLVKVGPHRWAPGEHFEGDPLPPNHPLVRVVYRAAPAASGAASVPVPAGAQAVAVPSALVRTVSEQPPTPSASGEEADKAPAGLALRRHCAWGEPGRNPYRGSVEEALQAARLPPEAIVQIAEAVQAGRHADRLTISNTGIEADGGGQIYNQRNFALTHGRTLCLSASVNFPVGHTERASLYVATDAQGKLHSVMVPDVCGNVSVLGSDVERTASETVEWTESGAGRASGPRGGGRNANANGSHDLPLPASGWLALLGLAAAIGFSARRRRA